MKRLDESLTLRQWKKFNGTYECPEIDIDKLIIENNIIKLKKDNKK